MPEIGDSILSLIVEYHGRMDPDTWDRAADTARAIYTETYQTDPETAEQAKKVEAYCETAARRIRAVLQ